MLSHHFYTKPELKLQTEGFGREGSEGMVEPGGGCIKEGTYCIEHWMWYIKK